jgi:glycosyltransferase involved in cell wall biosynthesis
MFSKVYTLYILLYNFLTSNSVKIVLAPRGMLKVSALHVKQTKKKVFLAILKQLHVYNGLFFHATDDIEKNNIYETLGVPIKNIMVIPNISVVPDNKLTPLKKEIGKINLVFISRVSPIKNLTCLLNALKDIPEGTIHLNIFGPIEDQNYWKQCEEIIGRLPKNISVAYNNELPHPKVKPELLKNHFLVLPTKGENFGHIIFESFAYGRPVIISDQTPWKGLNSKHVGWDVPIDDTKLLSDAIEKATNLDQKEYDLFCKSSLKFANQFYSEADYKNQYIKLFS